MRLLVAILLLLLPAHGSQQKQPPNSKQAAPQQSEPQPPITVLENHYGTDEQKSRPSEESPSWPPAWYSPFWPNWALVLVGLGTTGAALWTLFAVRDQSEQMRKQLDAFIETQKPHIALDPKGNPPHDVLDPKGIHFAVNITNVGLTTAYDCTHQLWVEVITPPFTDFSDAADYSESVAPYTLYAKHEAMAINIAVRNRRLSDSERRALTHNELEICFRVRIEFRDPLTPRRRYTEFGYSIEGLGFRPLPKYNGSN